MDGYIPGKCNIGPAERKKRRMAGYFGLVCLFILWVIFIIMKVPQLFRLSLFIPSYVSAIGFIQDRMHFCARFGVLGVYNFGDNKARPLTIEQKEMLKADRSQALRIALYSFLIAVFISLLGYLLIT